MQYLRLLVINSYIGYPNLNDMYRLLFPIFLVSVLSFSQTSQVSVYDEYGNDLGTYTVQSNYAEQNSNNLRMAVQTE